ncbi:BQ5605_C030g10793 [Microbotryum silenes-dioicae]|uniref:BQ5605_C030g10793 protein n=1 Tax=Microbotryum silenes-dioicae TaxID=796604 RepID=A0A2X0NAU3_9BASI|nr:BQ5605_C030g10793 [Microbotryum silenes-dioicae]
MTASQMSFFMAMRIASETKFAKSRLDTGRSHHAHATFDSTDHVVFNFFLALGGFATVTYYYTRVKSYLRFGAGLVFVSGMGVTAFIPRPSLRRRRARRRSEGDFTRV